MKRLPENICLPRWFIALVLLTPIMVSVTGRLVSNGAISYAVHLAINMGLIGLYLGLVLAAVAPIWIIKTENSEEK